MGNAAFPGAGRDQIVDLVFAVDSVPAIFAITTDPFVVLLRTSSPFSASRAVFALAADVYRFAYLKQALALVLVFIGSKIFSRHMSSAKFPASISLGVTLGLIAAGVLYSLYKTRQQAVTVGR